jgi:phage terminase large subunit-like protein
MGANLSGYVLDELHVFRTEAERMLYSALVTASAIREQPLGVAITTAGYDKHTLLGELYSAAMDLDDVERVGRYGELTIARDLHAGFLMLWYGAPDGADIENRHLWRAVNPGRGVRMDYLERQFTSPHLSEGEFRRYHLNQWTATRERWIADAVWRAGACELELLEDLAGGDVYLAVDAALTYDTTALDLAFPLPDGSGRVLHVARVWSARPDAPHDVLVPGGRIDNALVEDYIVNAVAPAYRIRELVYDPRFFEETASRLAARGIPTAPMQPGTGLMLDATARFYVDCQEGKVLHLAGERGGVLTQHVEAAAAMKTERGWSLSKVRAARPIDALMAMVMGHSRASRRTESVYLHRGLAVIGPDTEERSPLFADDDDGDW